jgi:PTH1 family peptidyl-tRNA hydrolase
LLRRLRRWLGFTDGGEGGAPSVADDEPLKVIVGLGNPGRQYENTRHNVGWWVVDHLADVWRFDDWRKDGQARVAQGTVLGRRVRLVKPQTYMNLSGGVLVQYARRPEWDPRQDLLVVVDDFALPLAKYRLRAQGSAGGHNGLKSIEKQLGHQQYNRLRIGIAPADPRRQMGDAADFVLGPFGKGERDEILALLPRLQDAVELWLEHGIDRAMREHNG